MSGVTMVMQQEINELRAEISRYRQALWDIRGIMGYDQDGDDSPRSIANDLVAMVVKDAYDFREEYEELLDLVVSDSK